VSRRATDTVWQMRSLTPTQKLVLLCLAQHANAQGECWPSVATIAEETGYSARAVQLALADLRQAGHIKITPATSEGGRCKSNVYRLANPEPGSESEGRSDSELNADSEPGSDSERNSGEGERRSGRRVNVVQGEGERRSGRRVNVVQGEGERRSGSYIMNIEPSIEPVIRTIHRTGAEDQTEFALVGQTEKPQGANLAAAARRVYAALSEARKRLNTGCRIAQPSDSQLAEILGRLKDGRSEEELLHVVKAWEALVRTGKREFQYFNAVTPFRRANIGQYVDMDLEDASRTSSAFGRGPAVPSPRVQDDTLKRLGETPFSLEDDDGRPIDF